MVMAAEYLPSQGSFPGTRDRVEYREGLNVGYRYFNSHSKHDPASFAVKVRYPFGHGLTYTRFEYSELRVTVSTDESINKTVTATFVVKNVGEVTAKEVVQLYVTPPTSIVYRPSRELKAFSKIELTPQESRQVNYVLTEESFSFFDIGRSRWIVEPGIFEILIGASIEDIRLRQVVTFDQGETPSIQAQDSYPASTAFMMDDATFARRFGEREGVVLESIQESLQPAFSISFDRNSLLKVAAKYSRLGSLLYCLTYKIASREIPPGPMAKAEAHMVRESVRNLPLRSLVLFGKGSLAMETMDALIALMNGHLGVAAYKIGQGLWYWILGKLGR
jgi:beta-glucosidase